ncbi:MAG: sulfite exporter TauE/SafE family protein [Dehalococcoidia bacterium]|nr:sulfite exporter TauE/SafE family protein [Dehalococcoidia bacterium]
MSAEVIAAGIAIAFLAAACQSVTGFGFALTMTPLLALVWDVKPTVATSMVLGLVILFPLLAEVRGSVSPGRVSWMLAGFVVGLAPGVFLLERLNDDALRVLVAGAVILAAVVMARMPAVHSGEDSIGLRVTAGFLSGSIGSSTSMGGPPVVLYLLGRERDNASFRATILAFFLPANALIVAAFAIVGRLTDDVLILSAAALPAMALGILAGAQVRRHLEGERFRLAVLAVLVATSAAVLAGAVIHLA